MGEELAIAREEKEVEEEGSLMTDEVINNHSVRLLLSARLISRETIFFSYNKTAITGL
jgi:hypothetical protein